MKVRHEHEQCFAFSMGFGCAFGIESQKIKAMLDDLPAQLALDPYLLLVKLRKEKVYAQSRPKASAQQRIVGDEVASSPARIDEPLC